MGPWKPRSRPQKASREGAAGGGEGVNLRVTRGRGAAQVLLSHAGEHGSSLLVWELLWACMEGLSQAMLLWPRTELWSIPLAPHPWPGQEDWIWWQDFLGLCAINYLFLFNYPTNSQNTSQLKVGGFHTLAERFGELLLEIVCRRSAPATCCLAVCVALTSSALYQQQTGLSPPGFKNLLNTLVLFHLLPQVPYFSNYINQRREKFGQRFSADYPS